MHFLAMLRLPLTALLGMDPLSAYPPYSAASLEDPMGPFTYSFLMMEAALVYHQSSWDGALSVCLPVFTNSAHSGGTMLGFSLSFWAVLSMSCSAGTS